MKFQRTGRRRVKVLGAGAAGLLVLTACGSAREAAVDDVESDVDESLLIDVEAQAQQEMGSISFFRLEAAVVDGVDPMDLGPHLAELYQEHDLNRMRLTLGDRDDDDAPLVTVDGMSELTGQEWGEIFTLVLEEEPDRTTIDGGPEEGVLLRAQLNAGYEAEADLDGFRRWQELELPSGVESSSIEVSGNVPLAADEGLVPWEDREETMRVSLVAPAGDGEVGVELLESAVEEIGDSETIDELARFDWTAGSDGEEVEIRILAEELNEISSDEFDEHEPEDFEVFADAEALADLAEEQLGEDVSITVGSVSGELVQRGPDPDDG